MNFTERVKIIPYIAPSINLTLKTNLNGMSTSHINYNEKLIGIAAIILVGLSFNDEKNFVLKGLDQLKKIIKISLTNYGFPKSRSIKQSIFFLKYLILIREWFKESQS